MRTETPARASQSASARPVGPAPETRTFGRDFVTTQERLPIGNAHSRGARAELAGQKSYRSREPGIAAMGEHTTDTTSR
jgi:hypothetical protein